MLSRAVQRARRLLVGFPPFQHTWRDQACDPAPSAWRYSLPAFVEKQLPRTCSLRYKLPCFLGHSLVKRWQAAQFAAPQKYNTCSLSYGAPYHTCDSFSTECLLSASSSTNRAGLGQLQVHTTGVDRRELRRDWWWPCSANGEGVSCTNATKRSASEQPRAACTELRIRCPCTQEWLVPTQYFAFLYLFVPPQQLIDLWRVWEREKAEGRRRAKMDQRTPRVLVAIPGTIRIVWLGSQFAAAVRNRQRVRSGVQWIRARIPTADEEELSLNPQRLVCVQRNWLAAVGIRLLVACSRWLEFPSKTHPFLRGHNAHRDLASLPAGSFEMWPHRRSCAVLLVTALVLLSICEFLSSLVVLYIPTLSWRVKRTAKTLAWVGISNSTSGWFFIIDHFTYYCLGSTKGAQRGC